MAVELKTRQCFDIESYRSVAWKNEAVTINPQAIITIDRNRQSFLNLINSNEDITVYGVTSGYGQMASKRLTPEQRRIHARQPPYACAVGFGDDLPERIKRGIVYTRLSNFIEGHAAVSSELTVEVSKLLDNPLPPVPATGNASAGEIVPLSSLFSSIWQSYELKEKEALALINGSPCASALMTDIAISARQRLTLCIEIYAMAAAAIAAPPEHYCEELEPLYGDPSQTVVLQQLRHLIKSVDSPRPYQAPVSWRIVPRVLGQLLTAITQLQEHATIALRAVTDNPIYVPPDAQHPLGQVVSNGGYHNSNACPMIDQISGCYADLALICDRQVSKLFDEKVSLLPHQLKAGDGHASCLGFIAADYADQARNHATRTGLIGSEGGGYGQNDVLQPVFQAWHKAERSGRCLDATLAILAVTCSQAFHSTSMVKCPDALKNLLKTTRNITPPVQHDRDIGQSVGALQEHFTRQVYRAQ